MAEVLVEYTDVVISAEGHRYRARACGAETDHGTWHGWVEFVEEAGGGILRTGRETTQPNRADTVYWATGLTPVYLEGALGRALHPAAPAARHAPSPFHEPPAHRAPDTPRGTAAPEAVLNPFSVYRKGETLLRRQLHALSAWHLVNIVRAYGLSDLPAEALNALPPADLIEIIAGGVRERTESVTG